MPPKILAILGLSFFVIATATFQVAGRWLDSRIFNPLEQPVSLDSAHLKSQPFEINLSETYSVSLQLDWSVDDVYDDKHCNYKAIQGFHWRVYRLGSATTDARKLAASSIDDSLSQYLVDSFDAVPGRYELEWDGRAPAPCLNSRHPRLSVWTGPFGYRDGVGLVRDFCLFLGGTGLALLWIAYRRLPRFARSAAPRIFPEMILRPVMPIVRHEPLKLISEPAHFGVVWGSLLMVLMFLYMTNDRLISKGQLVSWRTLLAVDGMKSPWPDTLEIYVRIPSNFFVNGEEVGRDELRAKLMEQLGKRVEWTVYLEADRDSLFGDTMHAIDVIHSCGAKVSWITPKMRKEWRRSTIVLPTN
jgi:biopolymer transport protein ExbD